MQNAKIKLIFCKNVKTRRKDKDKKICMKKIIKESMNNNNLGKSYKLN